MKHSTDRQTNRQTNRQTDRQTRRQIKTRLHRQTVDYIVDSRGFFFFSLLSPSFFSLFLLSQNFAHAHHTRASSVIYSASLVIFSLFLSFAFARYYFSFAHSQIRTHTIARIHLHKIRVTSTLTPKFLSFFFFVFFLYVSFRRRCSSFSPL